MRRLMVPSACLLAGVSAFSAGQQFSAVPLPAGHPQGTNAREGHDLPNSRLLARASRVELQAVPVEVWSFGDAAASQVATAMPGPVGPQPVLAVAYSSSSVPVPVVPIVNQQDVPIEIARTLGQNISAIVNSNGTARLVVADPATTVRRSLVIGDIYQAGWKLSRIDQGSVTLSKQGRAIKVAIAFSATPKLTVAMAAKGPTRIVPELDVPVASRGSTSASRRRISRRDTSGTSK